MPIRMNLRGIVSLGLAAAIMLVPLPGYAADAPLTAAAAKRKINLAGRQRMLSQRMVMLACLAESDVSPAINRQRAIEAIDLFGLTLKQLRTGAPETGLTAETDAGVLTRLDAVDAAWPPLADAVRALTDGGGQADMERARNLNLPVLAAMNAAVTEMETVYAAGLVHPDLARVINLAGRQRMLIQKVMKESCLVGRGLAPAEDAADVAATAALFRDSLDDLIAGNPDTGLIAPPIWEIEAQLQEVAALWGQMGPMLAQAEAGAALSRADLAALAEIGERALVAMNDAVWQYENF